LTAENFGWLWHARMTEASALQPGSSAYRRANLALFLGGWATFALLYGPQPLLPLANTFPQLVILRGLAGVATAGLPAAAMAWLGDEMSPGARSRAMGLYIAGNALGGMSGRFLTALVAFLLMGVFVAFYNYLGFRLSLAPFELGQTAIGAVFLLYALGTWSVAGFGGLADSVVALPAGGGVPSAAAVTTLRRWQPSRACACECIFPEGG